MKAYEGDGVIPSWKGARGTVQRGGIPTLMTSPETIGVVVLGDCVDMMANKEDE